LPIIRRLVLRDADAADPHIPLLLWWAVERHAIRSTGTVAEFYASPEAWASCLARDGIVGRLVRRYAAEGKPETDDACARLLRSAPNDGARRRLLAALEQGLQERAGAPRTAKLASGLHTALLAWWQEAPDDVTLLRLLARAGHPAARERATALSLNTAEPVEARTALLEVLGEVGASERAGDILALVGGREPEPVQLAALAAWQRLGTDTQATALLSAYARLPERVRARARSVLLGRKSWAGLFLRAVDAGTVPSAEVTVEDLQAVAQQRDDALNELVRKHWGTVRGAALEERLAEVRRLTNDLRAGPGDPQAGRGLFAKHCGACHRLFGEGGTLGPDLTHANRADRHYLLVSLVDPSGVIRKEYLSYTVQTTDGRVLTGLIAEQTPQRLTLVNANNETTSILRAEIATLHESPVSLMPEGQLKDLRPQELRDLFSYLQSQPPPRKGP
jgi:putative heme-binding domain-containing protein